MNDRLEKGPSSAAAELFARLRGKTMMSAARRRRAKTGGHEESQPFGPYRDPRALANVIGELSSDLGWNAVLAESDVLSGWPEIVGDDVAAHTSAESIVDGVLRVTCSSTAWATQLRVLSPHILTKIIEAFPEANITGLQFRGPTQPSWKHGIRTVPGRGPRDTYG